MEPLHAIWMMVSWLLALAGGAFLQRAARRGASEVATRASDQKVAVALLLTSLALLVSGLHRLIFSWPAASIGWLAGLGVIILWLAAWVAGLRKLAAQRAMEVALQASAMLLAYWLVLKEPEFVWADLLLLMALTCWVSLRMARDESSASSSSVESLQTSSTVGQRQGEPTRDPKRERTAA